MWTKFSAGQHNFLDALARAVYTAFMTLTNFVWVVRQNSDLTEGRGPMKDVAVCDSEDDAMRVNYGVCGVMGAPKHYGGEVVKVQLNTYPPVEIKVWGYRKGPAGTWGQGWLDGRDTPSDDNPEWVEYKRLQRKFDTVNLPPLGVDEAS